MEKLQTQPNSNYLQANSEQTIRISNIKDSLIIAMERTGLEFKNIDSTIQDVFKQYPEAKTESLQLAIKNGALGKYGRTYRLSTQEVFIWIDSYRKENPTAAERDFQLRKNLAL